jgi:hypothetical protein
MITGRVFLGVFIFFVGEEIFTIEQFGPKGRRRGVPFSNIHDLSHKSCSLARSLQYKGLRVVRTVVERHVSRNERTNERTNERERTVDDHDVMNVAT